MSTDTVKDGTTIYYKDWGKGPVGHVFARMPLNSDAWTGNCFPRPEMVFRVLRTTGVATAARASWSGNDMNGYADDLAAVIDALISRMSLL